jgi:uncharacterized protein
LKKRLVMLGLLMALVASQAFALDIPALKGRINDYAAMLTPGEVAALDGKLELHEKETSNQVVILTVPSLEGEVLEDFSIRVADQWKIGQKGKDNGVIILIALQEKKIRIEVGRGLEGVLTDLMSGRIIQDMKPSFKAGRYYDGLDLCVDDVIKVIKGEYKPGRKTRKGNYWPYIFCSALFLIAALAGFAHILAGGVVGAIGGPFVAMGVLHLGAIYIIPGIVAGFLLGMASRYILEYVGPIALKVGFVAGGGIFGGGGASGSWD